MDMFYELWDVDLGKGLARYQSNVEAATLVRTLVSAHGPAYADDLDLSIEDDEGVQAGSLAGSELIAWANGVLGGDGSPGDTGDNRAPTTYGSNAGRDETSGYDRYGSNLPMAAGIDQSQRREGQRPSAPQRDRQRSSHLGRE
jgi:hypothetical protein